MKNAPRISSRSRDRRGTEHQLCRINRGVFAYINVGVVVVVVGLFGSDIRPVIGGEEENRTVRSREVESRVANRSGDECKIHEIASTWS